MKRIVFVDDEPNILSGLKRMLRPMRKEWDMHFCDSADAALDLMASSEEPFDIVVTDMRMPGHDGAWLLDEVKSAYPDTARLILSGHAEQDMTIRSVAAAHQFIAKPCDAETLKATVSRTCRLRDMMANKSLQRMATSIGQLPSVPRIYQQMTAEMAKPEPSIQMIGKIVGSDLAMSAKVLQLVNSAFFGLRRRIASLDHAVTYLGMDVIRSLVLSESAFKSLRKKRCPVSAEQLMRDGQRAAHLAKAIMAETADSTISSDESFQAGLLYRLGSLILASGQPAEYKKLLARVKAGEKQSDAARELFGVSEAEIGGYLLGLWGLSDGIVEAIVSCESPQDTETAGMTPLVALHVALGLIAESNGDDTVLNADWLASIGMDEHIDAWRDIAAAQLDTKDAA
ncbi:MAG: HDOD domain-containing protein [Pseudomonadota bacterium]